MIYKKLSNNTLLRKFHFEEFECFFGMLRFCLLKMSCVKIKKRHLIQLHECFKQGNFLIAVHYLRSCTFTIVTSAPWGGLCILRWFEHFNVKFILMVDWPSRSNSVINHKSSFMHLPSTRCYGHRNGEGISKIFHSRQKVHIYNCWTNKGVGSLRGKSLNCLQSILEIV